MECVLEHLHILEQLLALSCVFQQVQRCHFYHFILILVKNRKVAADLYVLLPLRSVLFNFPHDTP